MKKVLRLDGKRIVSARLYPEDEAKELGWHRRPIVLELDDGSRIYAASDDEENEGGTLCGLSATGQRLVFLVKD